MVFDVSMWQYYPGTDIVAVKGCCLLPTRMKGGGRDFVRNSDGTLSPANATHLVFGYEKIADHPLCLVNKGDPHACVFSQSGGQLAEPQQQQLLPVPTAGYFYPETTPFAATKPYSPCADAQTEELKSENGIPLICADSETAIVRQYDYEKTYQKWHYIELALGNATDALRVTYDGNFIWYKDLVFDVDCWKYTVGNAVNLVKEGSPDPVTDRRGGGRDFKINSDGTISPVKAPHLVLGRVGLSAGQITCTTARCRYRINQNMAYKDVKPAVDHAYCCAECRNSCGYNHDGWCQKRR